MIQVNVSTFSGMRQCKLLLDLVLDEKNNLFFWDKRKKIWFIIILLIKTMMILLNIIWIIIYSWVLKNISYYDCRCSGQLKQRQTCNYRSQSLSFATVRVGI